MFKARMSGGILSLLVLASLWVCPSVAKTRGAEGKKKREQNQRRLYGERISRGDRGGEGGRNKGFQEFVSMMNRNQGSNPLVPPGNPTLPPTVAPAPTRSPNVLPVVPVPAPTPPPTLPPTPDPTAAPTDSPTPPPTDPPDPTFVMGRLNKVENGLTLSEGLSSRIIAKSGETVLYASGRRSNIAFHQRPSGGDTFLDTRGDNFRGWTYLSGANAPDGGIGSITFNAAGEVISYETILEGTQANKNGGRTPWNTWVSGEQAFVSVNGRSGDAFQVDPFGVTPAQVITMSEDGGAWEGFAYDVRDPEAPRFYLSEDFVFGCVRRFTPAVVDEADPWSMLQGPGTTEYLMLEPNPEVNTTGTFSWTNAIMVARANAAGNYPESKGIGIDGGTLTFAVSGRRQLYSLDLDAGEYKRTSTNTSLLEGEPNEIRFVTGTDRTLLYITEAGGQRAGVHARTDSGLVYTIFEGFYEPLTAGFALSPDGRHMYTSYELEGLVFDITRDDGLSFFDPPLDYEVTPGIA